MLTMRIKAAAKALREAGALLEAAGKDGSFGDVGAGRVYLMDGEKTTFEDLWLANAEEEDFIQELLALKKGDTMYWGGGAAADFEIKRIK